MAGHNTMKYLRRMFCCLLVVGLGAAAAAGEPGNVGRIFLADAGILDVSGSEIGDGERVRTVNDFAILHLATGHVLRMESNSAAILEAGEAGSVRVRVLAGRLSFNDPRGRLRRAGAASTFTLRPTVVDAATAEARLIDGGTSAGKRSAGSEPSRLRR